VNYCDHQVKADGTRTLLLARDDGRLAELGINLQLQHLRACSQAASAPIYRLRMSKIPIAIVGVGNCASSLVQGITFYGGSPRNGASVGLMHQQVGPYWPDDIEVVAAFDVDRRKVGIDVSEAIFALPNCTKVFCEKFLYIIYNFFTLDKFAER